MIIERRKLHSWFLEMLSDNGEPSVSRVISFISVCGFIIAFLWWMILVSRIVRVTEELPKPEYVQPWSSIFTVWVSFTAGIYGGGKLFAIPENLAKIGVLKKLGLSSDTPPENLPQEASQKKAEEQAP